MHISAYLIQSIEGAFEHAYWKFMVCKLQCFYIAVYGTHKPYISYLQIQTHLQSTVTTLVT